MVALTRRAELVRRSVALARPRLKLLVGVKTDPIECRFSYKWLFQLMADEGVHHAQLGTFVEVYHLPDESFIELRRQAEDCGVAISSVFTTHRDMGGFFRNDSNWEAVARRNFERLIEVGALLGASSVGANPGAVLRDRLDGKPAAIACYLRNMTDLMHHAKVCGVSCLTIEPMSCLAEPPTLPGEIRDMCEELLAYHRRRPETTSTVGCCADVSHGYADRDGVVRFTNMELLASALPYTTELHLKNTDAAFSDTFGFTPAERETGIVDIAAVRDLLVAEVDVLPATELVGYLEIGGPKLGRDYSDHQLEDQLRMSLRHLKETFALERSA